MKTMSPEEVREEIRELKKLNARIRAGKEPELARQIVGAVEERVLTEQPALSPRERSERLLRGMRQESK